MYKESNLWWLSIVRGVVAIIFGVAMLAWPFYSIYVVALLFASLLIAYGVGDIISGFMSADSGGASHIAKILLGVLEAGSGAYLLSKAGSGLTLTFIGLLVAINLIVMAIVNISLAFMDDMSTGYRWALVIAGLFTLFIGVSVASNPGIAAASLIWLFGVLGLFLGPLEIVAGMMLRKSQNTPRVV